MVYMMLPKLMSLVSMSCVDSSTDLFTCCIYTLIFMMIVVFFRLEKKLNIWSCTGLMFKSFDSVWYQYILKKRQSLWKWEYFSLMHYICFDTDLWLKTEAFHDKKNNCAFLGWYSDILSINLSLMVQMWLLRHKDHCGAEKEYFLSSFWKKFSKSCKAQTHAANSCFFYICTKPQCQLLARCHLWWFIVLNNV